MKMAPRRSEPTGERKGYDPLQSPYTKAATLAAAQAGWPATRTLTKATMTRTAGRAPTMRVTHKTASSNRPLATRFATRDATIFFGSFFIFLLSGVRPVAMLSTSRLRIDAVSPRLELLMFQTCSQVAQFYRLISAKQMTLGYRRGMRLSFNSIMPKKAHSGRTSVSTSQRAIHPLVNRVRDAHWVAQ